MKKYLFLVLLIAISMAASGQEIRALSGFDPITGRPGYIYRDTSIVTPFSAQKYLTGYTTWGSFPDTARSFFSGTSPISYNSSTGAFSLGTVPIGNGGTNITTYTTGDILYASATNVLSKLSVGSNGNVLTLASGIPSWAAPAGGISGSGVATRVTYWNGTSSITSDTAFRFAPTGVTSSTKVQSGLVLKGNVTALANTDTIVGLDLTQFLNAASFTGVKKYNIKIGNQFIFMDSLSNIAIGNGAHAIPSSGATVFMGRGAGSGATSAINSNFFGTSAGNNASSASESNFLGFQAGSGATSALRSNFFGSNSGGSATGASNSNFFGNLAGNGATSAQQSNFFGSNAGASATGAQLSNFFGTQAGQSASSASNSNFFGFQAGQNATSASEANFFGSQAGNAATGATQSNFFGNTAGYQASGASNSNFFGAQAGYRATSALNSIFMGITSGRGATTASYSTFLGYRVGDSTTFNITGSNNIMIGTNITLPTAATANSINLGNVLYGLNTYSSSAGTPRIVQMNVGKIGINVPVPTAALHLPSAQGSITGTAPLKFTYTSLATTATSGTGTVATITFATQPYAPFAIGATIVIAGVTPSGYNVTAVVTACTTTSVSYTNSTTGSQSVAGTVSYTPLLATPEDGAVEYNGTDLHLSISTTRYVLAKTLQNSATLDFGSTSAQSSADLTITVTGAVVNDEVSVGAPNGSVLTNSSYSAWVSATNTVTVRFNNYSSGSQDPASGTFRVSVIKH